MRPSNFITKCDRLLLQSVSGITKCDRLYYKERQVLQSVTVIRKWDVTNVLELIKCSVIKRMWSLFIMVIILQWKWNNN